MSITLTELQSSPEKFEGEKITINGFLVSDREGNFFLTSRPQVRSCCIHKESRIAVIGENLTPDFKAQEIHAIVRGGRLEEATAISSHLNLMPWTVVLSIGLLSFQYYIRNFRKKNPS